MVVRPSTAAVTACCPMMEKVRVPFDGAAMEYFPVALVNARVSAPCTRTLTPRRGLPAAEVTVPETAICWPHAEPLRTPTNSTLIPTAHTRYRRQDRNESLPGSIFSI